ncbi:hypothetical protein AAEX63_07730 [Luteococcus sp. H138]|uniref:hypothetical protein n=1 Tax=unclassified Luteococcus TaxID=2639923 RepID=UPI00313EB545
MSNARLQYAALVSILQVLALVGMVWILANLTGRSVRAAALAIWPAVAAGAVGIAITATRTYRSGPPGDSPRD